MERTEIQNPAKAASVEGVSSDQDAVVAADSDLRLIGYSVRESAGTAAAATVRLRDGTASGGNLLAVIELASNGSETRNLGEGVQAQSGLSVEVVAGTVDVVLHHKRVP